MRILLSSVRRVFDVEIVVFVWFVCLFVSCDCCNNFSDVRMVCMGVWILWLMNVRNMVLLCLLCMVVMCVCYSMYVSIVNVSRILLIRVICC